MAQDYANKSKPRKGAVRRAPASKGKSKKHHGRSRLGIVLLLVLLVAAGGFGLYQLSSVEPDPVATQQAVQQDAKPQPPVVKAPEKKPEAKPAKGDYVFYDMLPDSKVEPPKVPEYKSTPKSAGTYSNYVLQAGSFRDPAMAESLKVKLLLMNLPNVEVSQATAASGTVWYRVRTGPFDSRSKLNKAQDQLVRLNLQPSQIRLSQ